MSSQQQGSEQLDRSESVHLERPTGSEQLFTNSDSNPTAILATSPKATQTFSPVSDRLRAFTDATLRFIGNASNETLGACAVGLAASTYLVLGRLGLVLIGAFGGVLLTTTWDSSQSSNAHSATNFASRRRELGVEVVKRTLDWRNEKTRDQSATIEDKIEASNTCKDLDFSNYPPATAKALNGFTAAVIQDYVKYWYSPILPADQAFPSECRRILVAFVHSFSNHVSRKRAADPFLDFIANSTSVAIVFLQELAVALKASQRQEADEALSTYLQYEPDSNLANVLNQKHQKQKLHMVADDVLQNFLDSKTFNCLPARTFLREVLAGLILEGTLISCSKPEWINGWIVYLLEDGEPELMNTIDAGVTELDNIANATGSPVEDIARTAQHKRRVSRAEKAMEEAMIEAQRMNQMIADEEARKKQDLLHTDSEDTLSTTATTDAGIATPASSESEHHLPLDQMTNNDTVFDAEGNNIPSVTTSPAKKVAPAFTSFDQLEQAQLSTALQSTTEGPARTEATIAVPLTLHNASINIMDMGVTNDQIPMREKPKDDMLVQIEPASSRFPGWMVTRQYAAFEPLFDTLRRLAHIAGVAEFNLQYSELPQWKGKPRAALIAELERCLRAALKSDRLAESEVMKRFLDKETGLDKIPASQKNVFVQGGAALENVGKGFVNVLGQGGKGIQTGFQAGGKVFQTGGKAVLGGVTGVFGAVAGGPKRPGISSNNSLASQSGSQSIQSARQSQDMLRSSQDLSSLTSNSPNRSTRARTSTDQLRMSKDDWSRNNPPDVMQGEERLNLPPPPDVITDEFEPTPAKASRPNDPALSLGPRPTTPTSLQSSAIISPLKQSPTEPLESSKESLASPSKPNHRPQDLPISDEETKMTVELMFALITELLSLSSAWTFRLSLLTAAKSYLLRPNNPQLKSIRLLLQESMIDANLSDEAIATHIRKLRENALPTEEELRTWPKEPTDEEKKKLRVKARRLLVERGMPQALTTVVGVAASGEALGKVFDCLQNRDVARGLIFALMLQALRTVIQ